MKVTFTETVRFSDDGFTVRIGNAGETLDVSQLAACTLFRRKAAYNAEPKTLQEVLDEMLARLREQRQKLRQEAA